MNFRPVYLDSSALLKLVLPEPESRALLDALASWPDRVSSVLGAIECRRVLQRVAARPDHVRRLDAVLEGTTLIRMDDLVSRAADGVGAADLRTLDAIHLGTALSMGDHPEAFITYDDRLARAGAAAGLRVLQPGRSLPPVGAP